MMNRTSRGPLGHFLSWDASRGLFTFGVAIFFGLAIMTSGAVSAAAFPQSSAAQNPATAGPQTANPAPAPAGPMRVDQPGGSQRGQVGGQPSQRTIQPSG